MPLALTARIKVDPGPLLKDKGLHDIAHAFLRARVQAMKELKFPWRLLPKMG